ncbi:hypothetical protein VTO73DRAFT_8193 [Trametes versicolor]
MRRAVCLLLFYPRRAEGKRPYKRFRVSGTRDHLPLVTVGRIPDHASRCEQQHLCQRPYPRSASRSSAST